MAPRSNQNSLRLPQNRLRKPKTKSSQSSKELAELDEAEEKWCMNECNKLSRILTQPLVTVTSPSNSNDFNIFEANTNEYNSEDDNMNPISSPEIESETESDDSEQSMASLPDVGTVVSPAVGDYNRKRRIREHQQWQEVIEPMFRAFMLCKLLTLDWSQVETWNFDFKDPCRCSDSKKRVRQLDLIDILSQKKQSIEFCPCQPEQVRLIQMGYVGGSPVQPEIAFSLRLLRLHDCLWRYCSIRTHAFALGLEFFHRVALKFSQDVTQKPRRWGRYLSCAVDAYRRMNQLKQDLEFRAMELSSKDKLGANCPRCFGENVYSKEEEEPDYVVCMDGNFQQRRHKSASVEHSEIEIRYPNLFLHPSEVDKWENLHPGSSNISLDPCTQMHTAANDSRSQSTWRACDDTGLLAMVCRHDHQLSFVNIVQSGEKSYFAHALIDWLLKQLDESDSQIAFLYDIGCNLEKGLVRHNLFEEQRSHGRFKFGTSIFHAYVHNWGCQLEYNPRINIGFGMSDGEGSERGWFKLCKLIPALRYATKQHRIDAIGLKAEHENQVLRTNAAQSAKHKLKITEKTRVEKLQILINLERKRGYTHRYFADQWGRQKQVQLEIIEDNNAQQLRNRLVDLIEHEEDLREAKEKLLALRSRHQRNNSENRTLASLPGYIVFLEEEVEQVLLELGSDKFRDIPGAEDEAGRLLIQITMAKTQLYEAKVGIIELRRKWESGTSMQQRMKDVMKTKESVFKTKWKNFHDLVVKYNLNYPSDVPLINYTLEEIKVLPLDDTFWNFCHLMHPNEKWAVDEDTQIGIQAYLLYCRCEEELRRISHEVRQMLRWSLTTDSKIQNVVKLADLAWDPRATALPIDLVTGKSSRIVTKTTWDECSEVMESLHYGLFLDHMRLVCTWDDDLMFLLHSTRPYCEATIDDDKVLEGRWKEMLQRNMEV